MSQPHVGRSCCNSWADRPHEPGCKKGPKAKLHTHPFNPTGRCSFNGLGLTYECRLKKCAPKKKVKRVILGIGHPWFFSQHGTAGYDSIGLYPKDSAGERKKISPKNIGGWNKIRLVAEVLE